VTTDLVKFRFVQPYLSLIPACPVTIDPLVGQRCIQGAIIHCFTYNLGFVSSSSSSTAEVQ
jgi:hypothetical protein